MMCPICGGDDASCGFCLLARRTRWQDSAWGRLGVGLVWLVMILALGALGIWLDYLYVHALMER